MRNYIKAIKLFCEMNEISVVWKRITKGLPVASQSSDDRPPTIGEVAKLISDLCSLLIHDSHLKPPGF